MGLISGANPNTFKSADYIFARIKREFKSFDAVNLLDDTEFPGYVADVLKTLGIGALKEEVAVLVVKDKKAMLPEGFQRINAAYKCSGCDEEESIHRQLQNKVHFQSDVTCNIYKAKSNCEIDCECPKDLIESVTVRQYVLERENTRNYKRVSALKLSPHAKGYYVDGCTNIYQTCDDEITINNGCIFTNFSDGDIFLEYYGLPLDENNTPMIPDVIQVETAIEWYIKWRILLNFWLVDDVANVQNKWGKAEQLYDKALASAKYVNRLPAFSTLVNQLRNARSINKTAYFSNSTR